jgi:DNA-binding response OmpR family regulator
MWRHPEERLAETCEMLERVIGEEDCPNKRLLRSAIRKLRAKLTNHGTVTDELAFAAKLIL